MKRPIVLIFKALGPGERWITVRPNGPDTKGQPVLIQPQPDGSAKVIGGAGGALNHLRLTGVRKESDLKGAIAERAAARREARKKQRDSDRELGLQGAKAEAHRKVQEQKRKAASEFVAGVAKEMGWAPEEYGFDDTKVAGQDPKIVDKVRAAHELEMVKKARAAVDLNRERMLGDADARAEAQIGEIPLLSSNPDELAVNDIDPVRPPSTGMGFAPDYRERAEQAGLNKDALAAEAAASKKELTPDQRKAAIARGETAELVRSNLAAIRDSATDQKLAPKLVDAKRALALMKLEKKLKLAEKAAKDARKDIDASTAEPKGYVIEATPADVDKGVEDEVENDLRTIRTRAFLAEARKNDPDPVKALSGHINGGAFNSINALALAAGGSALIDRSVVDVLGIAGASEILARRLKADLTPQECKSVAAGMEDFHLQNYMEVSGDAIRRAQELRAHAAEMELGTAETSDDLVALQEINRQRGEAIAEARHVLGQAMGEMEANAALVLAMKGGKSDKPLQVSLGHTGVEDAIRQCRAIGLQRGDYAIEAVAGNRVLTVTPVGMDRLAAPVNRASLEQVKRNLDIINGKYDEEGWVPPGIADRPDLELHPAPGVAAEFAEPFKPGDDMGRSISDYAGARAADGDAAADIISDLQSADMMRRAGRPDDYLSALNTLLPLWDDKGKMVPPESLQPTLDRMADEYVKSRYGEARTPIQRQTFSIDDVSTEALHRALAAEPAGTAAYKPIGDMTPQDQGALREFFAEHVARESPEARSVRQELEKLKGEQPERETTDMFGDQVTNPEWTAWRSHKDDLAARVNAASLSWPKYVEAMHGPVNAYAAVQDLIRSRVSSEFATAYNTLNPGAPLKTGRVTIRNNLNHLDAVDPNAREARLVKERALVDRLRERTQGRYATGAVRDKLDAVRAQEAGFEASQMGFFSAQEDEKARPLDSDERFTIGHEAERRIASMMPVVGRNFRPGQPVNLFRPEFGGGKNAPRQRAIKMIEANKRVVLSFGTGSGKTLIGLAGFTNLKEKGKAKRGLFLVPSIVQGQYNAEGLRFLKPGQYKWDARPGESRNERIAAYKDQSNDFAVMTHQAFRDDMIHLGAGQAGISEHDMAAKLSTMSREDRKSWMRGVMRAEGINFDYVNVDEGHNTLNRAGKENSELADVIDSLTDNANYYVSASADPVKNDASEAFSLLQKMDPARYTDQGAFMRRYGPDTIAAHDGLRRELVRFQYPSKIDPDITATRSEQKVDLSAEQHTALSNLEKTCADIRMARMRGEVDVAGLKKLSPSSFAGVAADEQEGVARELQRSLGMTKEAAVRSIINGGAKVDAVSRLVAERGGKPGVIFAHSLAAVESIAKRLANDGHNVVSITGHDGSKAKAQKGQMFSPDAGPARADILVASDAAATGLNAQRGRYVINLDTPDTAKTHAQRNGRVDRIGQQNDVELIDLVANHPDEVRARRRLRDKYALRDMLTSPMEGLDDTGLAYFLRKRAAEAEQVAPA